MAYRQRGRKSGGRKTYSRTARGSSRSGVRRAGRRGNGRQQTLKIVIEQPMVNNAAELHQKLSPAPKRARF